MKNIRASKTGWLFCMAILLGLPQSGWSQDASGGSGPLRKDEIIKAEQAKEQKLSPLLPPHGEELFDHIETRIVNPIFNTNGFGVKLGGLPTGGGFSLGPRYVRQDLLREHLTSDSYVVGSTKKWWRGESALKFTDLFDGHLEVAAKGSYEDASSMPFFGEGPQSLKANQSNFRREFTTGSMGPTVYLLDHKLSAGYEVAGLLVNVGKGGSNDYPSTTSLYTEAQLPGIDKQSNFIVGTTKVALDLSHPSYNNPSGLVLEANDNQFWDRSGNNSSFHLLETQATYSLPFFNGMRTLEFRARNETAFHAAGQVVPFYLQPTMGGPNDLRGYERYRFYDNGSSVVSAEYRWPVSGTVEFAIFGDGGNVYARPGLIGIRDARGDGGFGVRFKNKQATVMRFDIGVSPEGVKVWFVFNDAFGRLLRPF